jgi:ribonuclease VapC
LIAVDTSAIVCIFAGEVEARQFNERITADGEPVISAGTLVELSIVLRTLTATSRLISDDWLDRFLLSANFRIDPVTTEIVALAREAHRRFGKGMGHSAQLNFGDCFAYALAKSLNAPLLYKGTDFARTDVVSAV